MFRPVIQKTRVLVLMAVVNLLLVFLAFNSRVIEKSPGYIDKLNAAGVMEKGLSILKKHQEKRNIPFFKSIDPNSTGLISKEESPIRSGNGRLAYKQAVLKPNFAALMVELFLDAGLTRGDTVAVCLTGSMPGANLAMSSAAGAMGIYPVVITSVAASTWGATDPEFTWLDMEKILFENDVISHQSAAASIGGRGDCLRRSGDVGGTRGRKLIKSAIARNGIPIIPYFLEKDSTNLSRSIEKRIEIFKAFKSLDTYDAFINIGGGASSVGVGGIQKLRKNGVLSPEYIADIQLNPSVMKSFEHANVAVIHILRISNLIKGILPPGPKKLNTGEGLLYFREKYNLIVAGIATFLSMGMVIGIGWYSKHQINEQLKSYEVESII